MNLKSNINILLGVHVVHAIIDGMIDTDRVRGMVGDKPDFVSPEV